MRMEPRIFFNFQCDHEDEAAKGEPGGRVADVAQAYKGVRVADDEARMLKADEGDEDANTAGDGRIELVGNGVENHLPDAGGGERKKDDAGEEDSAEGGLPGDVHLDTDRVGEIGVEAHARGEGDGVTGDDAHQDGAEGG